MTTDHWCGKILFFLYFFLAWSCILNPPLDPQSGCRRQCLGVGAKTVVTLGLGLGLFNSFLNSVVSRNLHFLGGEKEGQWWKILDCCLRKLVILRGGDYKIIEKWQSSRFWSVVNGTGRSRHVAAQNNIGRGRPWPAAGRRPWSKKKFKNFKKKFKILANNTKKNYV